MTRCSVLYSALSAAHDCPGHPESAARMEGVLACLPRDVPVREPAPATGDAIGKVHDPFYLQWLASRCAAASPIGYLDADTYVTPRSCSIAALAAGAAMEAADRARDGGHCFSLLRPPGHHALPGRAMGFCLINNVAVAACHALQSCDRVAIVDWDVHHGNGTQAAFWKNGRVLYCSVHQAGIFPFSGEPWECGAGPGERCTMNVPLPARSGPADYFAVFSRLFCPAIERFSPDLVLVSAGQDILSDDPLGMMELRPEDCGRLAGMVWESAGSPLALVLEGGYGPSHGRAVRCILNTLDGKPPAAQEPSGTPRPSTEELIRQVKAVHHLA